MQGVAATAARVLDSGAATTTAKTLADVPQPGPRRRTRWIALARRRRRRRRSGRRCDRRPRRWWRRRADTRHVLRPQPQRRRRHGPRQRLRGDARGRPGGGRAALRHRHRGDGCRGRRSGPGDQVGDRGCEDGVHTPGRGAGRSRLVARRRSGRDVRHHQRPPARRRRHRVRRVHRRAVLGRLVRGRWVHGCLDRGRGSKRRLRRLPRRHRDRRRGRVRGRHPLHRRSTATGCSPSTASLCSRPRRRTSCWRRPPTSASRPNDRALASPPSTSTCRRLERSSCASTRACSTRSVSRCGRRRRSGRRR